MALKFSANLNFLFTENSTTMLDRFRLAAQAGFKAVENGFPADISVEQAVAVQKETGLNVALLNICLVPGSEFGCTAIPQKESLFKETLNRTIEFAKALKCKKIHLMAGKVSSPSQAHHDTYIQNLKYAAGILATENITGVIEPICVYGVPGYYLSDYDRAINVLKEVNSANIKLMIDLYHLQHIKGNITHTIKELQQYIGHIQIAQVPSRNEPNSMGELNYSYILKELESIGYSDWIGLEYKPRAGTVEGLKWIEEFGYKL